MEKPGKNRKRNHACENFPAVFHRELRTEALLCGQPQGADKTPGREGEKGDDSKCQSSERPGGHWTKRGSGELVCVLIRKEIE